MSARDHRARSAPGGTSTSGVPTGNCFSRPARADPSDGGRTVDGMVSRSLIDSPPGAPPPAGVYSHAVLSGGFAFLAGQVPERPSGGMLQGSIGEETALCLNNLEAVCAAAGGRLRDAVRVGVYLTDLPADFASMNAAYTAWFGGGFPARTTIGVTALAAGARIEIDAVVPLPSAPAA